MSVEHKVMTREQVMYHPGLDRLRPLAEGLDAEASDGWQLVAAYGVPVDVAHPLATIEYVFVRVVAVT